MTKNKPTKNNFTAAKPAETPKKKKKKSRHKSKIVSNIVTNNTPHHPEKHWHAVAQQIIAIIDSQPTEFFTLRKLAKKLGVKPKDKILLGAVLDTLVEKKLIQQLDEEVYQSFKEGEMITGRVDYVNREFAYIISEQLEEDVWVHARHLHNALDGDTVKVLVHTFKSSKMEGEVVEIVERARKEFVGKVEISTRFAFVVTDYRKMFFDIFVPLEKLNGAKNGDKVVVEMLSFTPQDKNPVGRITKVLGKAGENETEIHAIMAEFGLPMEFPPVVHEAAEAIPTLLPEHEILKRRDFRGITTFTIDPEDAKDFDDALSIRKLENGNWEIGVHIADVSHYVQPDTLLDQEAQRRATSVYLVDRVVPMLPEKLSNNLCSLRPNEDKFTFSAVFEINERATVVNQWFGRTVIYSNRRFTYEEAQERIETGKGDFAEEILLLNQLAKKLKNNRFKKGAIAFESLEVKFKLDEKAKPIAVIPKIRKDAHKLIEEFMLLANKLVAEFVFKKGKAKDRLTMVYRTHGEPNEEKLGALAVFAKQFGYTVELESEKVAKSLNQLSIAVEGKPEQNVLQSLAMRAMAKAIYTTEPLGHYGLAFQHYSHFTSPIRRYPDVMAHRLLQHYLDGGSAADRNFYEEKCKHCSQMERKAADAERASIKYKQAEYMRSMKGVELEGMISGVTEWGIYVEVMQGSCEGLVRLSDLSDDHYEFREKEYAAVGRKYGNRYQLGDKVNVKVKQIDMEKRTIDFFMV
jgi:ribonuclease R